MTEFDHILNNPFTADAKVIADSISPEGIRITSVQEVFWTPVLAERNTHKNQYGNCASQRAIPVEKILKRYREEPAYPASWPSEQPGMVGGEPLEGQALEDALALWDKIHRFVGDEIEAYLNEHPFKATRLHKGHINRLMTFGQWSTRITTATAWQNFFDQRCDGAAQAEIQAVAFKIRDAMQASTPEPIGVNEWHLPYVRQEDKDMVGYGSVDADSPYYTNAVKAIVRISAARCGRTSYLTQEGVRDPQEDLNLYARLIDLQIEAGKPVHWSPLEHVATPWAANRHTGILPFTPAGNEAKHGRSFAKVDHLPIVGALYGWRNLRTEIEAEHDVVTYR